MLDQKPPNSMSARRRSRVDGPAKVTGQAQYAAEFDSARPVPRHRRLERGRAWQDLRHRHARRPRRAGRRTGLHAREPARHSLARLQVPGRGRAARLAVPAALRCERSTIAASRSRSWWRRTYHVAAYAASLVKIEYEVAEHATSLEAKRFDAYVPPKKRSGVKPPPSPRGDAPMPSRPRPCWSSATTSTPSSTTTRWSPTPRPSSGKATAS